MRRGLHQPVKLSILCKLITQAVKLTSLLAQYLYTNHRLDLPGIGSFLLDPSAISSVENSKQRSPVVDGISFEYSPTVKTSPELIAYISSQSGKMKALASADLDSHIQLVQQFLNLGKPFTFDGIGTLSKKKNGSLEFSSLSVPAEKVKEFQAKEVAPVSLEESSSHYESFLAAPKMNFSWRRPVVALLVLAGIALAIWGGYTISKKAATSDQTPVPDVVTQPVQPDSNLLAKAEPVKSKDYKYILQVSKKQTAIRRYNQLKTNLWDVKMETSDSVLFKLYMLFPSNTDTTHVLDSLTAMTGKKVYIEPQN
jgi:hypothetical protein